MLYGLFLTAVMLSCGLKAEVIGEYTVPSELKFERMKSLDKNGMCGIAIPLSGKRKMILLLPTKGIACPAGSMKKVIAASLEPKKTIVTVNIGGRTWFGNEIVRNASIVMYHGLSGKNGMVYPLSFALPLPGRIDDEARRALAKVKLGIRVEKTPALKYLGQASSQLIAGRPEQALATLKQAELLDPRCPQVYYFRGMGFRRMKQYPQAIQALEKALALKYDSSYAILLAEVRAESGNRNQAVELLKQAVGKDPDNDRAWCVLAENYYHTGRVKDAVAAGEQAAAINPCSPSVIGTLVKLHLKNHDAAAAYCWAEKMKSANPGSAVAARIYDQAAAARKTPSASDSTATAGLKRSSAVADSQPAATASSPKQSVAASTAAAHSDRDAATVTDFSDSVAAFKKLPRLPAIRCRARAATVAPQIDPAKYSEMQYHGAVTAVREAMLELAGTMTAEARKKFDASWAAIYDYPAEPCIAYLNRAAPLLGELLSLRGAMIQAMQGYDSAVREAATARMFGNHEAAHELMRCAGQQAELLRALRNTMGDAYRKFAALGELPDAAALKAAAANSYNNARRLFMSLEGAPALEGEYVGNAYLLDQHSYGNPYGGQGDYLYRKVTRAEEKSLYIKVLTGLGNGLVLVYFNEQDKNGENSSMMTVCEQGADGSLSFFTGGVAIGRITLTPVEDGLLYQDYNISCRDGSKYDKDFESRIMPQAAKGKAPSMPLATRLEVRRFEATGRQFQKMPRDGQFNPDDWQALYRKHGKKEMEEFLQSQAAFATLLRRAPVLVPAPPENVFWVFDRIAKESKPELSFNDRSLYGPIRDFYRRLVRADKSKGPAPTLQFDTRVNLLNAEIRTSETWKIFDRYTRDVADTLLVNRSVQWGGLPPVLPATAPLKFSFKAGCELSRTKSPLFYQQSDRSFHATVEVLQTDARNQYIRGNQYLRSKVFFKAPLLKAGTYRDSDTKELPLTDCFTEVLKLTMRSPQMAKSSLAIYYKQKVMTPEKAAELSSAMGGKMADLAAADLKAKKKILNREAKAATSVKRQDQARQDRIEAVQFHQANVAYVRKRAAHLQDELSREIKASRGRPSEDQARRISALRFNLICAQSDIVSENDRIQEVKTGVFAPSRTPFDDFCRVQLRENIETNIRRMEAVQTQRNLAEAYRKLLPPEQQVKLRDSIQKIYDDAPDDLKRWQALNNAMKKQWQGQTMARDAASDESLALADAQLRAVQNIKTAADGGMMICSMFGGPQAIALTYQFATGTAEKGVLEGVKQTVTTYSDAVDIAWSAYDGYREGGWPGAIKAGGMSLALNKGVPYLLGRMKGKGADAPDLDLNTSGAKKAADAVAVPKTGTASKAKGGVDDVAQYAREMEQAGKQVKQFVGDYHAYRKAVVGKRPQAEIDALQKRLTGITATINGNPTAKGYLKYKAPKATGAFFDKSLEQLHRDARKRYYQIMDSMNYGKHEVFPLRNASSAGTASMDFDQALKEQPNFIRVRGADGSVALQRNLWLTKNGKAVSKNQWQKDAQQAWEQAYREASGGHSAKKAWENMTTSIHPEAYRQMDVLKMRKDLSNAEEIMDNLDPKWVRQMSDVTMFKAGEMLQDKSLSRLTGVREACRGTAKDLKSKFLPFIETKLTQLKRIPAGKRSASDAHNIKRLEDALDRFRKVEKCFSEVGEARIPPTQWDDAIRLSTGGKGIMATLQDLGDINQSLFSGKR